MNLRGSKGLRFMRKVREKYVTTEHTYEEFKLHYSYHKKLLHHSLVKIFYYKKKSHTLPL